MRRARSVADARRRRERVLTPAVYFGALTGVGLGVSAGMGAVAATLFLVATLAGLLGLRRVALEPELELGFAVAIVLQGWGNALLLFARVGWYDKAVHFLTPMLIVPGLWVLLARAGVLPDLTARGRRVASVPVALVATALGTALATCWELVEGTADRFGAHLAHGYYETIDDLYASTLGAAAGAALLISWLKGARAAHDGAIAAAALPDAE